MINYSSYPPHKMLCIDMKSFYASCECVALGLNPLQTYLVVVGDKSFNGSIVLAATPLMKKDYGIKTGSRFYEVPRKSDIIIVEARMGYYLEQSVNIVHLLNSFVPLDDIHVYSVDEAWVCLNGTERALGSPRQAASAIKEAIYDRYGLIASIGIGPNKFLAKVIMDIEAKKTGIAECWYKDVQHKLWPQPVEKIWGIGKRMKKSLNSLGILILEHLANYPLELLKRKYGIIGEQLYWHAWGIDTSPVHNCKSIAQKSFAHGITLVHEYRDIDEIKTVILELVEEVARRARTVKMAGRTICLGINCSLYKGVGFFRSRTIGQATSITGEIYRICLLLFKENFQEGMSVKSVYVALTRLSSQQNLQLSFFEDRNKQQKLGYVVDQIREIYGNNAVLRAKSFTKGGVMLERCKKIGGHKA